MDEATTALVIMSLLILFIFLGFLIWGIKSKQFQNIEEAKYQIFKTAEKGETSSEKMPEPGETDHKC
jgi:cbb3-type cytochrome oxidase maturation protein